jgi:hypothetical protein
VRRAALAAALLLSLRSAGDNTLPDRTSAVALRWHVGQALWGDALLTVAADGAATYRFRPAPIGAKTEAAKRRLDPKEVRAAVEVCEQACGVRSKRAGIPDEGQPELKVARCEIVLWDGEWREDPKAAGCSAVVDRLIAKIRRR